MQAIRCTKKLQKRLRLNEDDLREHEPDDGILGPWHANIVEVAETPVVLLANDRTLINFFIDLTDDGPLDNFRQTFVGMLACVLSDLGVEPRIRDRLLEEYQTIHFAPTNNRRVIGSLNDIAFHYDLAVSDAGGIHSASVPSIIREMNGMPMSMLTEISPDRTLFKLIEVLSENIELESRRATDSQDG